MKRWKVSIWAVLVCTMIAFAAVVGNTPAKADTRTQEAEPLSAELLASINLKNDWDGLSAERMKDGIRIEYSNYDIPESDSAFVAEYLCRRARGEDDWIEIGSTAYDEPEKYEKPTSTPGASGGTYLLYRYDTNSKNGQEYFYKVIYQCEDGSYLVSKATRGLWLKPPKLTKYKSTEPGEIELRWSKNSEADGYQIEYSCTVRRKTGGKVTSSWTVKTTKNHITLKKHIKAGRTYRVRVRAYKTVNGVTYTSTRSEKPKVKVAE